MRQYPRVLYQPPGGRPRWTNEHTPSCGLQYLSWGWRSYGQHPIPVSRHLGWTYQLILAGRTVMNVAGRDHSLRAGDIAIVAPSCPIGWGGSARKERCQILNWTWREPPLFEALRSGPEQFKVFRASAESARTLAEIHEETRAEARFSDEGASLSIEALRIRLDVLLFRLSLRLKKRVPPRTKIRQALAWLRLHPEELRPVSALSDYLQISPATLNRLFRSELNDSVRTVAYAVRMKAARKMLKDPALPVKELAFRLGYSHANDFSRAYNRFWNDSPRR